ncbi:monocyte to macrophage differentiation factor isoform X2 [Siniperca chuatsi]|uniref:monocyte to macrophage differentiation factor isoform X2 n=1 Tax=Siniperca chuatsi TaxID=119488 RepID=UPI001CE0537F|nr:monocyte to macrophage differentiation factor isoform X2 [Siniperca chuatsi]
MKRVNIFPRFMNRRASTNCRYQPTCYEHAANCYTHALLIVPAFVGMALLHRLSDNGWEKITAWVYGMGLCALFLVSTVFHIITWKKSHMRSVEHCFHMCDRVVIYFFIAASYTPWLNLRELGPLAAHMRWFVWLMAAAGTIYVFNYHEKATLRGFRSWPAVDSSTASVCSSSRATASSPSPTPSGTSLWRWLRLCTTTPSGNTSTRPPAPTPSSSRDHSRGRTPVLPPCAPEQSRLHNDSQLPTEAATTAAKFTKIMTMNCLLFSTVEENRFFSVSLTNKSYFQSCFVQLQ